MELPLLRQWVGFHREQVERRPDRDLASVGLRSVSSRLRPGVSLVTCDRQWALAMPLLTPQTACLQGHCLWLCKDAVCEEKDFLAFASLSQGRQASEEGRIGASGLVLQPTWKI